MSETLSIGTNQSSVYNALVPPEGPKSISQVLPFDGTLTAITLDLTLAFAQTKISVIQTVWFDASLNPGPTRVLVQGTAQSLVIPAGAVGCLPLICAIRPKIVFSNSSVGKVWVCLLNVPLPSIVYQASGAPPQTAAQASTFTVAIGGTAVFPFAAGAASGGVVITNPHNAPGGESLFVDYVNVAGLATPGTYGTTFELTPGASLTIPAGTTNAVSVNAALAGHAFVVVAG